MLTKAISFGSGIHAAAADTRPIELPENLGGAGEHRYGHEGPATGPGTADHDALPAIEPDDHPVEVLGNGHGAASRSRWWR